MKYDIQGHSTLSGRLPNEKNDCTVRAYSEAFDIPYLTVHGIMMLAGRKARRGFNFHKFMLEKHPTIKAINRPHMTVGRFIEVLASRSNWIINTSHHVFAVKNGVIIDINPLANINSHVITAWLIKVEVNNEPK